MIEKIKLEQLEFTEFKELKNEEKEMKYCSLRDAFKKVFPLFSEIYELSKTYDSRSKFAEDENYINTRIEIGEILLNLRNSHKENGFSDSDYEFLNELLDKWTKLTKYFPVFGGDVSRLYLFWFLSFIDILENIFYSDVKIISFVDIFFFEKILDYILSEKGEAEAEKENLFRVFERFKPPIDHYRALTLILSHLKIKNDEIKNKLFEFYDSLIPKLKNKINYSNLLLTKANFLIKQEEYKKAFELLEGNKNLILKENPIEWISKIIQIKRENYKTGEKIRDNFNKFEYVKSLFLNVSNEYKLEFSLLILSEIRIVSSQVKGYIYEIGFSKEVKDLVTPKILTLYIRALIKQEERQKVKEELLFLLNNYKLFAPIEFLNTLFLIYWEFGVDDEEVVNKKTDDELIKHLISGLRVVPLSDFKKFLFVWGLIEKIGLRNKNVKLFLGILKNKKIGNSEFLNRERKLLEEYLEIVRKEISSKNIIDNFKVEKFIFSEFAGDLFRKDISLKETKYFNFPFSDFKIYFLRDTDHYEKKIKVFSHYLPFLNHKIIDFSPAGNNIIFSDRRKEGNKMVSYLYKYNLKNEKSVILKKVIIHNGLASIYYDKKRDKLLFYDRKNSKIRIFETNKNGGGEKLLYEISNIAHAGKLTCSNKLLVVLDYKKSNIIVIKEKDLSKKIYFNRDFRLPEAVKILQKNKIIVGFRDCKGEGCSAIIDLEKGFFKKICFPRNLYKTDSFCFIDDKKYFISINNKLFFINECKSEFIIEFKNKFSFLRIEYDDLLYIYDSKNKKLYVMDIREMMK